MENSDRQLQDRAALGVFLMIVGLALYPLSDALLKHLMGTYSVSQTTFLRAFTRVLPLGVAALFQGGLKHVLYTDRVKAHLVRLLVNVLSTFSFMIAFSKSTLTAIYTLGYTAPLFMIILSSLLLKEQISWDRWAAVFAGMAGVIIAMQPGSSLFEWASLIVLFGAFAAALNKILMRRLASSEHSLAIAIYPNIVMMMATLPVLVGQWVPMAWSHWALFGVVGLLTALAQYSIAQAVRCTKGSTLSPIDYSTYFWVVALDFCVWGKTPAQSMVVGALIIASSNLYILYRARCEERVERAVEPQK